MPNEELSNYIKQAKESGMTDEEIRRQLLNSGWKEDDVNSFFKTGPDEKMRELLSATQLLEAALGKLRERYKQAFQIVFIFAVLVILSVVFSGSDESLIFLTASIVVNLLLMISSLITVISLVYLFGKDEILTLVEYFKLGLYKFWSYVWISIIYGFIIFGGYILVVVPGILFGVWFSMSYYVLILEDRKGLEALTRSRHLIVGKFWATVWRFVFWGLVTAVFFIPFVVLDFIVGPDLSRVYSLLGIAIFPLGVAYYVAFFKNLVEVKKEPFVYDKKSGMKFVLVGLVGVLILVAGLAFGGYYYFTKLKPLLQTSIPTPISDPTADWKTYRNEQYGFEFKHPSTLFVDEFSDGVSFTYDEKLVDNPIYAQDMSIQVFKSSEKNLLEFMKVYKEGNPATAIQYSNGSISGYYVPAIDEVVWGSYFFSSGKNVFRIDSPNKTINSTLMEQILSTFKFIEPIKGTLLIYDPNTKVSELHGKGFKPLTWYLVPKDIKFPGTPDYNMELLFNSDSICAFPEYELSPGYESQCNTSGRWGYGDRVRIYGENINGRLIINKMEIVSSLPIDRW